jgi:hypothetical protein
MIVPIYLAAVERLLVARRLWVDEKESERPPMQGAAKLTFSNKF